MISTAIGLVVGAAATRLMLLAGDRLVELTISLALAYGTYLLADQLHESGIIATVVNGEILMEDGKHTGALPGRVLRNTYYRTHRA